MINIYTAIYALNSAIVTIRGNVAYDANEQEVVYDKDCLLYTSPSPRD